MPSLDPIPTTLRDQLRQLGLAHTASKLDDFVARATQKRWSPVVQLERLADAELAARLQLRVERRLKDARLGRYKAMADFEWQWPTHIHRPTVERVLTLDFLAQRENVIIVASHGLGKTMLAKNLVHQAILAGHSARFLTAADLILDLTRQETARALQHRLRSYLRPHLLAIDEVGYLTYDAHAADPLSELEVTADGYGAMARMVGESAARLGLSGVALALEGGYDLDALRSSSAATLTGLLAGLGWSPDRNRGG